VEFLNSLKFVHRDLHPSRIQQFPGNQVKFNTIGLPYNFKKLLKRDNFSGHINYSAPELILEKNEFSSKVDSWAIGCCLYYLIMKKDPFDGKDPREIKQNILNLHIEDNYAENVPEFFKPLCQYILVQDENKRPFTSQVIQFMDQFYPKPINQREVVMQQSPIGKEYISSPNSKLNESMRNCMKEKHLGDLMNMSG
jgi:serine/threonine protein kinase